MRDVLRRYGGHLGILAVVGLGIWAARIGLDRLPMDGPSVVEVARAEDAPPTATRELGVEIDDLPAYSTPAASFSGGIQRRLSPHTIIPSRPRLEVVKYTVKEGDTLFGIAESYGLKPESLLFANFDILEDNPHALRPGQELNIPPVDGALYTWHEGDSIQGVASFFGVTVRDVLDWPGNNLDPNIDPASSEIEAGTLVMIPGGEREFRGLYAPRIPRSNPAAARVLGAGYCGTILEGAIGTGTFMWPTTSTWLSGYSFSAYHPAIDIGGSAGSAIYASDNGVVVYSGWNDWGYGYLIVLDHGTGWQSLYAHLSAINVGCGQSVFQGTVIGGMGCTGNCSGTHLHFEMQSDLYGKVNPLNFLP